MIRRPPRSTQSRSSAASDVYKRQVPVVEANSKYFYIRAQRCASLYDMVKDITYWNTETIGFKEYQLTSIEYAPFGWHKTYRYVITREKKVDKQGDLFTGDDFTYRAIMTNNREITDLSLIHISEPTRR